MGGLIISEFCFDGLVLQAEILATNLENDLIEEDPSIDESLLPPGNNLLCFCSFLSGIERLLFKIVCKIQWQLDNIKLSGFHILLGVLTDIVFMLSG